MLYLIIITSVILIISFIKDRKKTITGLKKAVKKMISISIPLLSVLIFVSLLLYLIPENTISEYLSNGNIYISLAVALLFGSITIMPGFIAFPLGGILLQNHVPFMVISGFTSALMMVGILTFPIEKKYFGIKVAVLRNTISFLIAVIVSLVTGIFFGELI